MLGLSVAAARRRAHSIGCRVRFTGAPVGIASVQTIRSQSVAPGRLAKLLKLTVNPLCPGAAFEGPPPGEPIVSAGPTELDAGLFLQGGAFIYHAAPVCHDLVGTSSAGTITVTNS